MPGEVATITEIPELATLATERTASKGNNVAGMASKLNDLIGRFKID